MGKETAGTKYRKFLKQNLQIVIFLDYYCLDLIELKPMIKSITIEWSTSFCTIINLKEFGKPPKNI